MSESYKWVIANYDGEQAKKVLSNAHAGVGYFVLESGGNNFKPTCLVAFRYVGPMPLPYHLQEVRDQYKIAEYEKRRLQRSGIHHA